MKTTQERSLQKGNHLCIVGLIWILAFQNPLERTWEYCSYIDEIVALLGFAYVAWKVVFQKKYHFPMYMIAMTVCIAVFVAAGLAGNVCYRYQPWKSVIIDVFTNLKFFFAVLFGYGICDTMDLKKIKKQTNLQGKNVIGILFVLFLFDRFVPVFHGDVRYGMRSAELLYTHPTYLAGATAFLAALLMAFYEKKNTPFIAMSLIMLVFTLRSKAFASAAVFVALFIFFILLKMRLKLWHMLIAAAACVVIAWPQISYYFIELGGRSTRSVMHSVGFQIAKDYFPIGTGFATYASAEASKVFSPVYELYNFEYLLRFEVDRQWLAFLNDTFWPIIIGQTGVIGTVAYVAALGICFERCWRAQSVNVFLFAAALYAWCHLLICSIAEPAFNNATAIPLAMIIGMALCVVDCNQFTVLSEKDR